MKKKSIDIEDRVYAPLPKVWRCWTHSKHIKRWNFANEDWHIPQVHNDFRENGRFSYRMEAKDGSAGFELAGRYRKIIPEKKICYTIDGGSKVKVKFVQEKCCTCIKKSFKFKKPSAAEQLAGWQAILNNFKTYVEKD